MRAGVARAVLFRPKQLDEPRASAPPASIPPAISIPAITATSLLVDCMLASSLFRASPALRLTQPGAVLSRSASRLASSFPRPSLLAYARPTLAPARPSTPARPLRLRRTMASEAQTEGDDESECQKKLEPEPQDAHASDLAR